MTFLAFSPPGMLNMNACNISYKKSLKKGILFSLGASIVVFFQASLALLCTEFLMQHPEVVVLLKYIGLVVFLLLAIYFYFFAGKQNIEEKDTKKDNCFLLGMGLSLLNMMAIPYFLISSTLGETEDWFHVRFPNNLAFSLGAAIGVLALLFVYSYFAKKILVRSAFIANNSNKILSIIFLGLALLAFIEVW